MQTQSTPTIFNILLSLSFVTQLSISTDPCPGWAGRCGSDWTDANTKCGTCCNWYIQCTDPDKCFANVDPSPCSASSATTSSTSTTVSPTSVTPSPIPAPTSVTPSPTSTTAAPIPAPTSITTAPIPAPTSVTPSPTSTTAPPIPAPTSIIPRNNRIRSSIPPATIPLSDIPMFLTITFDDALHQDSFLKTSRILNHVNRNGEKIPLVYYISNEWSDYSLIQQRYLQGCEIAIHTISHTTNDASSITKWYHEIKESRELISTHCDIPIEEIVGFRAPFLEKSDNMFQVLTGITPSYSYDSTIISKLDANGLFNWPYTLDNYEPNLVYHPGEGPKKSYPGFWEIPMYYLYNDIANRQFNTIMDYGGGYDVLFDALKKNFDHRYNTNKSPMGIYFHANHLSAESVRALNDFIEWVLDKSDSWIVTNKQVIDWINNPVEKQTYSPEIQNALINGTTNFNVCQYAEGVLKTVQQTCPQTMPHSVSWDESQVIPNADVIITTNPENIVTNSQYVCTNDVYTDYEIDKIYLKDGLLVMYDNALYECQWWTQGQDPTTNAAWKLVKTCIVYTDSFVQGSITPLGAIDVFIDSVLRIDIQPYSGEQTFDIFVNGNDLVTVFNNAYSLVTNAGSVQLTVVFSEISMSVYNIQILFDTP